MQIKRQFGGRHGTPLIGNLNRGQNSLAGLLIDLAGGAALGILLILLFMAVRSLV